MLTGDKEHQNAGNVQTEEANWKKSVMGEGVLPQMGSETIKGKVERSVACFTRGVWAVGARDVALT